MKREILTAAIVTLVTVVCASATTGSPVENRYVSAGNRAGKATDSHREESTAGAERRISDNGETRERWKRAFAPWNGEHSEFQTYSSFSVWKPAAYQINRPYYIPVYGAPGTVPIYFPPQSFDYDLRYPTINKPPFVGPSYLPPYQPPTTQAPPETTMTVKSRFDFDDDDDDRPVWNQAGSSNKERGNVPTRPPPPPPGMPEFPSLLHDVSDTGTVQLSAQDEEALNQIFNHRDKFTTAPPRTRAPPQRQRPATTRRPPTQSLPPQTQAPPGPSNCVWAVVSCCSAATNVYPERCFEARGCPGPFWGSSPCDTEFAKAAVEAALKYYDQ